MSLDRIGEFGRLFHGCHAPTRPQRPTIRGERRLRATTRLESCPVLAPPFGRAADWLVSKVDAEWAIRVIAGKSLVGRSDPEVTPGHSCPVLYFLRVPRWRAGLQASDLAVPARDAGALGPGRLVHAHEVKLTNTSSVVVANIVACASDSDLHARPLAIPLDSTPPRIRPLWTLVGHSSSGAVPAPRSSPSSPRRMDPTPGAAV